MWFARRTGLDLLMSDTTATAPGYSTTRRVGDTLYVAGTIGLDPRTGALPDGGVEAEIDQMMRNVQSAVTDAGFTMADIVATTAYVTGWDLYPRFNEIYVSYFDAPLPTRATVRVAGLVAGASIEISAVAAKEA
jgi:2-iminobutanoate/2-iminopropanoate deaminase